MNGNGIVPIQISVPGCPINPAAVNQESSLPYLRNPYPDELGTDPSFNYRRDGGNIRLEGKYEENFFKNFFRRIVFRTKFQNTNFGLISYKLEILA